MFFFFVPVGVEYQARRYPMVTFTLIGLNTVIFLVALFQRLGGMEIEDSWYARMCLVPADSHWYTWITTLFVHFGFMHLIGNMVFLFLFGSPVEDMMGRVQYILFYLLGGMVADIAHIAFSKDHFDSEVALGGASGAISACMGAFAVLMFKRKVEFKWFFIVFFFFIFRFFTGDFFLPAWLILSFWFVRDLISAILDSQTGGGGVAFGAHVGGFVGGAVMILLVKQLWRLGWMKRQDEIADDEEVVTRKGMTESAIFYVFHNEEQIGPFTVSQIRQMIRLGSINRDSWYWCEGMTDWKNLSDLVGK